MVQLRIRRLASSFAVLGLVLLAAAPARAVLSGANNGNFTGFTCPNGNNGDGSCQRSSGFTTNTGTTFTSRYAWNVNADIGIFSTRDSSSAAQHNITFTATAPGGYRLDISTSRVGALGRLNDASGCDGSADTSGVGGSSNIALNSGTLSLADPGSIGNGGADTAVPYSQSSGTAQIFRPSNGVGQNHTLTFTWSGSVRSNSCEASIRQGEGSGTTSGCTVCGYPGTPSRTQALDGHFVTVAFTSLCGNGAIDGSVGEQCDLGSANGAFGNCCNTNCTYQSSSTACRNAAGPCDAVDNCTGSSATCPADAMLPSSTPCRPAVDNCDLVENCTGSGPGCPADFFAPFGTPCRASAGVCDLSESCIGSSPFCPVDAKSTAQCRASAGSCDVAENCNGVSNNCPADVLASSSTVCRASGGVCDIAENCTGGSPTCPADAKSTAVCRASADVCDVAESCNGVSNACPADAFESSSTVCRASAGDCDVTENCSGSGAACPTDSVAGAFLECRPSAGDCDPAENCDGIGTNCPADILEPASTVCRASAGACDVAENCTGSGPTCPADSLEPGSTVCRAAAGTCDVTENCTGSGPACPADALEPASTVCRASGGVCDLTENCTGSGADCPTDAKATVVCRASAGGCDAAESCDGVGDNCPTDVLSSNGTVCRAATGTCDVQETCNGVVGTCPPDVILPDGTSCNDGTNCTGPDTCEAGVCSGEPNADACADDFLCYKVKAPAVSPMSVSLADQFETATAEVRKLKQVCTPADKNAEGVFDTTTHLVAYQIKSAIKHVRRTNVLVENQIGSIRVDTTKVDLLLVPSNKDLTVDPPAPNINLINVDHYKCYKVKVTPGTPKLPKGITVSVEDQFNSPAKVFELKKPRHLCNPVDKNGEGIKNEDAHLFCYSVKGTTGQPKHVRQSGVHINNQIGVAVLGTTKEAEICIPSIKTLAP